MKVIPDKLKEASIMGIVFTILFLVLISLMILNQLMALVTYDVNSELLIDHFKDDQDMIVSLDVTFPNYPCGMLSLDKMDVLHSHIMDVSENLKKLRINNKGKLIAQHINRVNMSTQERVEMITS